MEIYQIERVIVERNNLWSDLQSYVERPCSPVQGKLSVTRTMAPIA